MNNTLIDKLYSWLSFSEVLLLAFGVLVLLIYLFRLFTLEKPKKKYDFINRYEIKVLKYASIFIILALTLLLDDLLSVQFEIIETAPFIGGMLVIIMIGVLIYSGIKSTLDVYYAKFLGNRLDKIRYKPRISVSSGHKMKLLNEDEEDFYLTEDMQRDENTYMYDYDVWIDPETKEVQIEKYDMHQSSLICSKCKFRTLKEYEEHIESDFDKSERLIRNYKCSYCGNKEVKELKISNLPLGNTKAEIAYN